MTSRHVLGIGLPVTLPEIVPGRFLSRQNFSEFDLIIWDPASLLAEIHTFTTNRSGMHDNALTESDGNALTAILEERSNELWECAQKGKDLILVTRELSVLRHHVDLGMASTYQAIDLPQYSFMSEIEAKGRHGNRVEWVGPPEIPKERPALATDLSYSAICTNLHDLTPLYCVAGGGDVVGGYFRTKASSLICLVPHTRHWNDAARKAAHQQADSTYASALLELPDLIRRLLAERSDQPRWAAGFALPMEDQALSEIQSIEARVGELREQIQSLLQIAAAEREWKYLFTAHDEPLVNAVIRALGELGITAVPGPNSHADVIAVHSGRLVALEVKGKAKSAARTNVEQCRTWVSEITSAQVSEAEKRRSDTVTKEYLRCLEEVGISPCDPDDPDPQPINVKGILLINAYRDLPLDERTQPGFPHSLHRNINENSLCALTTLQLLGMVLKVRDQPAEADRLAQLLFDHVGVVEEFSDWSAFLTPRNAPDNNGSEASKDDQ